MHTFDAFLDELTKVAGYRIADGYGEEVYWQPKKEEQSRILRADILGALAGGTAGAGLAHVYIGKPTADFMEGKGVSTYREYLKSLGTEDPRVGQPAPGRINERKAVHQRMEEKKKFLRLIEGGGEASSTPHPRPDLRVVESSAKSKAKALAPKFKARKFLKKFYGAGFAIPAVLGALTVSGLAHTEAVSRGYKNDLNARHYVRRKKQK